MALESVPAEGVTLRGKVDAVFDEGEAGSRLTDWKTGSLGDPGPQLGFYALLWALERGDLPGRVEAVSLASGERVEEVPTRAGVQADGGGGGAGGEPAAPGLRHRRATWSGPPGPGAAGARCWTNARRAVLPRPSSTVDGVGC